MSGVLVCGAVVPGIGNHITAELEACVLPVVLAPIGLQRAAWTPGGNTRSGLISGHVATVGIGIVASLCSQLPGSVCRTDPNLPYSAQSAAVEDEVRAVVERTNDHTIAQKTSAQTASAIQYH